MMSFKNIRPGGYVRSGLARMSISFYNKLSGDSWFLQKRTFSLLFFWNRTASYNMALNEWCNDLFRCKETLHPHNHVCVCVLVDVGKKAYWSFLKHLYSGTSSDPCQIFQPSNFILAEHLTEVPSSPTVYGQQLCLLSFPWPAFC